MAKGKKESGQVTLSGKLETLIEKALKLTKTARRNRVNLSGENYYGNKLAELRADANNVYRELPAASAGDSAALAELIEAVFAPTTRAKDRAAAARDALYSLRTTWRVTPKVPKGDEGLFPLSILSQAKRSYLVAVGRQMNACYTGGWYDASAVMMRRLLEIAIIEAFEGRGLSGSIRDPKGNYFQLSELIKRAQSEKSWSLSRNCRTALPKLMHAGHNSAHGRYYLARREDIDPLAPDCRIVIEEFLHLAGLL